MSCVAVIVYFAFDVAHHMNRYLVAIGAILTIVALGFHTFTQQVVSLGSASITGGDASLYHAGEVSRSSYEDGYDHGSTFSCE